MEPQDAAESINRHFDDKSWMELAKNMLTPGIVAPDRAAQMHAHLDAGCESCQTRFSTWRLVVETTAQEAEYEPPESVVQAVHQAFLLSRKVPLLSRLADAARLVFDSFRQPLPAGVRGAPSLEARHLVHESGDLVIDIRLENESHNVTSMAGQILKRNAPVETTAGAGVVLLQGHDKLIAHTIANRMGEFQLEFERSSGLTVFLELPDGKIISVPLPGAEF